MNAYNRNIFSVSLFMLLSLLFHDALLVTATSRNDEDSISMIKRKEDSNSGRHHEEMGVYSNRNLRKGGSKEGDDDTSTRSTSIDDTKNAKKEGGIRTTTTLDSDGISKPFVPTPYNYQVFVVYSGRLWEKKKYQGEWNWQYHHRPQPSSCVDVDISCALTTEFAPVYVNEYAFAFDVQGYLWKKKIPKKLKDSKSYLWVLVGPAETQDSMFNNPQPPYVPFTLIRSDMVVDPGISPSSAMIYFNAGRLFSVKVETDEWNGHGRPPALPPNDTIFDFIPIGYSPPIVVPPLDEVLSPTDLEGDYLLQNYGQLWSREFDPDTPTSWQFLGNPEEMVYNCGAAMTADRFFCSTVDGKMVQYKLPPELPSPCNGCWDLALWIDHGLVGNQDNELGLQHSGVPTQIGDSYKLHVTSRNSCATYEVIELYQNVGDTWVWFNHGTPPTGIDDETLTDVAGAKYGSFVGAKTSQTLWELVYTWNVDGEPEGWSWVDHGHP